MYTEPDKPPSRTLLLGTATFTLNKICLNNRTKKIPKERVEWFLLLNFINIINFEAFDLLLHRLMSHIKGLLITSIESHFDQKHDPIIRDSPVLKSKRLSDIFSIFICEDSRPNCTRWWICQINFWLCMVESLWANDELRVW